ncbi:MAG: hypothetical protein OXG11_01015 [Chloroflexi bacterium]|nr:hypothetical protein [Chloroflexota bacterium]
MTPPRRGAEEDHESDAHSDPKPSVALSREQQRLHGALCELGETLGAMYLGGLQVLHDPANPDRVAQSAHSMRELMEKIGEVELTTAEGRSTRRMKNEVFNLRGAFTQAKRNSAGYSESGGWTGPFDGHLYRFLKKLNDFFDWVDSDRPSRRAQFQRTLVHLDPSGRPLAKPLRDRRYRAWREMWDFFQDTSHHRAFPGIDEFRRRIGELEVFLASVLVPRTFDDMDAIDALLKEAGDA